MGALLALVCTLLITFALAQTVTDPSEVEALKAFGSKLGLSPPWDFSVDPCSNASSWIINGVSEFSASRGVLCTCTNGTCHIIKISVVSQNVEGEISPEIGRFQHLESLNLQANRISGQLPEEIGNLSSVTYITVASNKLVGQLPKTIGKLSQLLTLSVAVNNFTGNVPEEIGNLALLRELYMDSSGLGGELPATFAKLAGLKVWNFFDNSFTGNVPEFIANMTSLETLAMYGNGFHGQIPAVLASLPNLKSLEIGDVKSGGIIPPSFNSLSKLTKLSLRNCELNGSIPEFKNLTELQYLDLSFNNLSGPVPSTFSSTLQILFLGSNKLTGRLPSTLSSIQQLDVSFNDLSGPFNVTGNATLVGNMLNVSTGSPALDCLEGNFGCNKLPSNSRFAINCGGPEITSDGTRFRADQSGFETGQDFSETWAVSSSGYAESFKQAEYFESIANTGGAAVELYRTAKTAPTSLRYFGLGMVTGPYTVRLYFAEIIIGSGSDGPGLGRRIFDIYIQGNLLQKDFDIINEAKAPLTAVVRSFKGINVSGGILDIHLLWKGKGTCCAPFRSFGPLISAIEVEHEFDAPDISPGSKHSKNLGLAVGIPVVVLGALAIAMVWFFVRRHKKIKRARRDFRSLGGKLHIYSYNDLRNATGGFSPQNLLGKGGFSAVYKGVLPDGTRVAIKQLFKYNQDENDFLNEATLISSVRHRNLVKLLGCCIEREHRMLVLEFLENNSLYHALLSKSKDPQLLLWPARFNICLGIARGIAYLHEESSPRIIHRDIKATNVLLDQAFVPKIADFGLAKLFEDHESHISTRVAGTMGYLAPEYALRGILTEKADVYSFGVLALELVSGRPNMDSSNVEAEFLLDHAWKLYDEKNLLKLVDENAQCDDSSQALRVILVALTCCQTSSTARPTMSSVVSMLSGNLPVEHGSINRAEQFMASFHISAKFPQVYQGSGTGSSGSGSYWSSKSAEAR